MNNDTEQIFLINASENQSRIENQKVSESVSNQVNLENVEDFTNVCRTCATITEFVIPIFMGEGLQNNLADKIHKHLPIKVTEEDVLPRVVCYQCASTLLAWHELVQCCVQADNALKTRLAVILAKEEASNNEDKNLETDTNEIFESPTEFVVRSNVSPQIVDNSNETRELNKICQYCGVTQVCDMYTNHLITTHSELVFHCNECDSYLDRKDFIIHMSMHAVQPVPKNGDKQTGKRTKKLGKRKNSKDKKNHGVSDKQKLSKTEERLEKTVKNHTKANSNCREAVENEFSDHSDVEYFGRLPESVFEAIEDSQESERDDNDPCSSPTEIVDNLNEKIDTCMKSYDSQRSLTSPNPHAGLLKKTDKKLKKPRTCPICSKVYTAASSYFYHLKNSHQQSKEYECDVCGKKFRNKSTLAQHASVHDAERRLECKECGKRFKSKASLYIHEQSHTDVRTWSCDQCSRSFRWRTHLLRHVKRHAAERSHVCATCGRGFNVRCDLLRHARTHAAGSHACEECHLKFAQQRYLRVHMIKKHCVKTSTTQSNK